MQICCLQVTLQALLPEIMGTVDLWLAMSAVANDRIAASSSLLLYTCSSLSHDFAREIVRMGFHEVVHSVLAATEHDLGAHFSTSRS
jgi:hypothetical protein